MNSGEIGMLNGPSGIGKTTLLQLAGLLELPTSGQILINNIYAKNEETYTKIRREKIGFIYQFHHLLPEFSILKNVMLPLLISGISEKIAKQRSIELLDELGLKQIKNNNIYEVSGGQKQRAAIARAIIGKPKLIIADEPTGNLDPENARNIFDLMIELARKESISILVATHNDSFISKSDYTIKIIDRKLHKM
jgi:lipoprotein-releasing system ATP-binding protein